MANGARRVGHEAASTAIHHRLGKEERDRLRIPMSGWSGGAQRAELKGPVLTGL